MQNLISLGSAQQYCYVEYIGVRSRSALTVLLDCRHAFILQSCIIIFSQVESPNIKEGKRYLVEFSERQRQLPPLLETLSSAFAAAKDAADNAMTDALDMCQEAIGGTLAKSAENLLIGARRAYAALESTAARAAESRQERLVKRLKEEQAAEQAAAAAAQKRRSESAAAGVEMAAAVNALDRNIQALAAVQDKQVRTFLGRLTSFVAVTLHESCPSEFQAPRVARYQHEAA